MVVFGRMSIPILLIGILIGGGIGSIAAYIYYRAPAQNAPQLNLNFPHHQLYNATLPPTITRPPTTVKITLVAIEHVVEIAPDVFYHAWTFNGTIPGPAIRVRVNDTVEFTMINNSNSTMPHSVDFHAIQGTPSIYYQSVNPGSQFKVNFKVLKPGVFLYHCGTPPVYEHLTNGMYGAIIVDPSGGLPPAREYMLVQSEIYMKLGSDGVYAIDLDKAANGSPDYMLFNGFAAQYQGANALRATVGEKIRVFVVNAGPNVFSAFHAIGDIFDKVYDEGSLTSPPLQDVQTATVPPGGSGVFEWAYNLNGTYPLVSHAIWSVSKGLVAYFNVTLPSTSLVISTLSAPTGSFAATLVVAISLENSLSSPIEAAQKVPTQHNHE